ncbi:hypothetical protein [Lapidilactobacillus wuchangensis]|uniref:hypothetical protein n=1 Tax=Lapidilactobacillus wuchangensis TaxID=2486001 RepID=UPI000F7800B7|nr:hypothetical protein [Lapidilactobacillus wuchangensis]
MFTGIITGGVLIIAGLAELYFTGTFSHWVTKKGSGSTSPFTLAGLGAGFYIGLLFLIVGISAVIAAFTGGFS